MKRLHVLVEGQTEETFVRDVLGPHLAVHGVHATSVILKTKRVKSGGAFRGGVTSTAQVIGDIGRLLGDTSATVTTLLDYYGLPEDFPGMKTRAPGAARSRVEHVEQELAREVANTRLLPHLTLHEYEAWIFAAPEACDWVFDDPRAVHMLAGISATMAGPENIDEGPATAPSKRLQAAFPGYRKTLHGPMAVGAIGLSAVRKACPHADCWLTRLESL